MTTPFPCYIGVDSREEEAASVCIHSLKRHSSVPIFTMELRDSVLRYLGLYDRKFDMRDGIHYDEIDGKPFSTEFAFTRFLVPSLARLHSGWALFCDSDMLFRGDVAELLELADPAFAVMVVKHQHHPRETVKMDGQIQSRYPKKNWSSFMLWNCDHPANRNLTVDCVNREPGSFLHQFGWLKEEQIGNIPQEWNWLEGSSPASIDPRVVHFTRGGPWMPGYENVHYAEEWRKEKTLVDYERDGLRISQIEALTGGRKQEVL